MPIGIAAAILGGTSLIGSGISAVTANNAARTQANAANQAIGLQSQEFQQEQSNLLPFLQTGQGSAAALSSLFGVGTPANNFTAGGQFLPSPLTAQGPPPNLNYFGNAPVFNMPAFTQAQFQQSPGYQYQLGQITDATRNAAVPGQGALSGATLKALQQNGAGLANQDWWNAYNANTQNYTNQFNANTGVFNSNLGQFTDIFNASNQNYWNRANATSAQNQFVTNALAQLASLGQGTAANLGQFGQQSVQNIGNLATQGANATAAGQVGVGNALIGGANSISNLALAPSNVGQNSLLAQLLAGGAANPTAGNSLGLIGTQDTGLPF